MVEIAILSSFILFILIQEPHYHSEVLSLHGFHFELKAVRNKNAQVAIFMQVRTSLVVADFGHLTRFVALSLSHPFCCTVAISPMTLRQNRRDNDSATKRTRRPKSATILATCVVMVIIVGSF